MDMFQEQSNGSLQHAGKQDDHTQVPFSPCPWPKAEDSLQMESRWLCLG